MPWHSDSEGRQLCLLHHMPFQETSNHTEDRGAIYQPCPPFPNSTSPWAAEGYILPASFSSWETAMSLEGELSPGDNGQRGPVLC